MRRGQILSLDALLSLVIVVMVIGVVINANDMIKAEITNLVEWYDKANIVSNMLDVLTKSPGCPKDWEEDVTRVRVVGLRSADYSYALDYDKLMMLNSSINHVRGSLLNLSGWKDFQLEFYLMTKNFSVSGEVPENLSVSLQFIYPANLSKPSFSFAIINGTVVHDIDTIVRSKNASPWIEYQERRLVVAKLIHNNTVIARNQGKELMVGKLRQNIPICTYLEVEVPQEAGNVTFVILDGEISKGLLIKKDSTDSNVTAVLAWKEGTQSVVKSYEGNTTTVKIPWKDIFGEFNPENGAKPVEFWLYESNFNGNVILRDLDNIGLLLGPKLEPILIKLWVWDDR